MRHARRKTGSRTWLGVVLGFRLGLGLEQEHGQPHRRERPPVVLDGGGDVPAVSSM